MGNGGGRERRGGGGGIGNDQAPGALRCWRGRGRGPRWSGGRKDGHSRQACWETPLCTPSPRTGDGSAARAAADECNQCPCAAAFSPESSRLRTAGDEGHPPGAPEEEGPVRRVQEA